MADPYSSNYENDPLTFNYDPLGSQSYQHYFPPAPPPAAPAQPTYAPAQPTYAPAQTPSYGPATPQDFLSFPDYAAMRGGDDSSTVYNDYIKQVLPSYVQSLGYTPDEQAEVLAEFQRGTPQPQGTVAAKPIPERTWTEALVTDPLASLAKGGNSLMKGANWFLDFVSPADWDKTRRDWLVQNEKDIDTFKSEGMQAREARQTQANSNGVLAAVTNAVSDPVIMTSMILESLPSMAIPVGASGAAGKFALEKALAAGLEKDVAEGVAKTVAQRWAMLGEGATAAGQVGSDIDVALDKAGITDDVERAKWNSAALPAGIITAALGRFSPVEASLFTNKLLTQGVPEKLIPAFLKNASKESVEEYLQSANERYWTNIGSNQLSITDPKAWDGVAVDAALGALVGGVMGGTMGAAGRRRAGADTTTTPTTVPEQTPIEQTIQEAIGGTLDKYGEKADTVVSEPAAPTESPTPPGSPAATVQPDTATASATQQPAPTVQQENTNGNEQNGNGQNVQRQDDRGNGRQDGQEVQGQGGQLQGQSNGQEGRSDGVQNQGQNENGNQGGQPVRQEEVIPAPTPAPTPTATAPTLPDALSRATPKYGFGNNNHGLQFANDVDMALYVVADPKKKSGKDVDYMTWLQNDVYPGESEGQIRDRGNEIKQTVKSIAATAKKAEQIKVPTYYGTAGAQASTALSDIQIPDHPEFKATTAIDTTERLMNNVEKLDHPATAAAFIAVETEALKTDKARIGGVRRSEQSQLVPPVKQRIGQPSPAGNTQGNNQRAGAVQPNLPGQSSGRVGNNATSTGVSEQSVAQVRDEIMHPTENLTVAVKDSELQALSVELSTLPSEESKALANYLYDAYDTSLGTGRTHVDRAKVLRARAIVADAKRAYNLKKKGITSKEDIHPLINPTTGNVFDSPIIKDTFAETKLTPSVVSFLREGNLEGALQGLYLHGSSPLNKAVAGRLAKLYLGDVKVRITDLGKTKEGGQIGGRWVQDTLTLELDSTYGLTEHVLLHEAIHAATIYALKNPTTPIQKAAVQELTALFLEARRNVDPTQYAFKNLAEFVAEVFSDPKLQYQLFQIDTPTQPKSLWTRFINAVTKLVGLDNLLGKTMNVAEALFMSPISSKDVTGSYAAVVATPNTDPANILIKRTNKEYVRFWDREGSTLNFGKQLERALKLTGTVLPTALNVRLQNVLKRATAETYIRKWTASHWDGITNAIQNTTKVHGKSIAEVEEFLIQLQVLGRAQQSINSFDPTNANYAKQKADATAALNAADKYLSEIETKNPTYFRAMIAVANKIKAGTDATVDARVAARGSTSAADAAKLKKAAPSRYMPNGFYIPLQVDSEDGVQVALMKQSLGTNFKADQPLARVFAQVALTAYANEANTEKHQILVLAEKYNLVDEHTGLPLFEIGPVTKLKRNPQTGLIEEGQDSLVLDKDAVGVWVDGNYVRIKVRDPGLRESLGPVAVQDMGQAIGLAVGAARHFTQLMSVARTSANPGFAIFNFLRDQGAAALQLDPKISYGAYYAALLPAIGSAFYNTFSEAFGGKQTAGYQKAMDAGAFISQRTYVGLADTIRDVSQDLAPTLGGRLKAGLSDPFSTTLGKVFTGVAQSLETATRLAIYDAAIASGLSTKEAAYQSKTTTTNFERKSAFTNMFGPFYMFVNARAQGTRTLFDKSVGLDANPRTQVGMSVLLTLGLIAAAIGYDKSEKDKDGISKYFKIADYKRDSRIIMKEGTPGIPMPQEASLFYVLGNSLGDVLFGSSTTSQGIARFVKNLIQQAAPLGAGQADPFSTNTSTGDFLMRLFLPTMAQLPYDLGNGPLGRDTFGRNIIPDAMRFKGKSNYEKYTKSENPNSIELAKAMYEGGYGDVAPAQLTYIAKYLEGGAATFWKDMFNPKEPSYPGQSTNPLGKRFSSEAVPYVDTAAYKEAMDDLTHSFKVSQSGRSVDPNTINLYNRFTAFEKLKTSTIFKGYTKMDEAQTKAASDRARELQMDLMRDYYLLKGVTKP